MLAVLHARLQCRIRPSANLGNAISRAEFRGLRKITPPSRSHESQNASSESRPERPSKDRSRRSRFEWRNPPCLSDGRKSKGEAPGKRVIRWLFDQGPFSSARPRGTRKMEVLWTTRSSLSLAIGSHILKVLAAPCDAPALSLGVALVLAQPLFQSFTCDFKTSNSTTGNREGLGTLCVSRKEIPNGTNGQAGP